jgi:hypothetical protein
MVESYNIIFTVCGFKPELDVLKKIKKECQLFCKENKIPSGLLKLHIGHWNKYAMLVLLPSGYSYKPNGKYEKLKSFFLEKLDESNIEWVCAYWGDANFGIYSKVSQFNSGDDEIICNWDGKRDSFRLS